MRRLLQLICASSWDQGGANIAEQAAAGNQEAQQQQQKAVTNAQDFRANLPNYEQDQQNTATDSAKAKLANTMSGIDSSANSRGLLYSGLKQGAEANAAGGYASDLAATKANINQNAESAAEGMENAAVGQGLNQQQIMQQQNDAAYQQALAAQQQKFGMLGKCNYRRW